MVYIHLYITGIDLRQKDINHHLWKVEEGITSCYLKFISRAKKGAKKIAQGFLSCTYTDIHSVIFLPLLDIYLVHIHDMALMLEKGDMQPSLHPTSAPACYYLSELPGAVEGSQQDSKVFAGPCSKKEKLPKIYFIILHTLRYTTPTPPPQIPA